MISEQTISPPPKSERKVSRREDNKLQRHDRAAHQWYLIKRLTDFRQAGKSFGQQRKGKMHAGITRKILANEFDNLPKDLPVEKFDEVVQTLKAKIDNTALGRNNHSQGIRNYHRFEELGTKTKRPRK